MAVEMLITDFIENDCITETCCHYLDIYFKYNPKFSFFVFVESAYNQYENACEKPGRDFESRQVCSFSADTASSLTILLLICRINSINIDQYLKLIRTITTQHFSNFFSNLFLSFFNMESHIFFHHRNNQYQFITMFHPWETIKFHHRS